MKEILLSYGTKKIVAEIPEKNYSGTLEVNEPNGVKDPEAHILQCLRAPINCQPLKSMTHPGSRVAIIVSDHTRLVPTRVMLPPILSELKNAGVTKDKIHIIFGCGTHREVREEEARNLLGEKVAEEIEWSSHNCEAEDLIYLGTTTRGTRVAINPLVAKSDLKILTGDISYHFFAGYGGGRKSILPAVASKEAITKNHSMLTHPKSEIGILEGNPVHEDMVEGARLANPNIIVNVVQNTRKEVVKAFCGELESAFYEGVKFLDKIYKVKSDRADIVIVSAGGYPKDIDLYQAYKAIHNSLPIVNNNGAIILVAECREGAGNKVFQEWMKKYATAEQMREQLEKNFVMGAHKAYYLARALQKTKIYMITEIPPKELEKVYKIIPVKSVEEALEEIFNTMKKEAKIKVIPHGSSILAC